MTESNADELDNVIEPRGAIDMHGVAATVVILRDGSSGPEVLLLERPRSRGSFAGAWVFPGGVLDPGDQRATDHSEEQSARRAGARETAEETGFAVAEDDLVPVAVWSPPQQAPKRMRTWFFYTQATPLIIESEPTLAVEELVDFRWITPGDALAAHARGELELVPPTWVTLDDLSAVASVAHAMAWANSATVLHRHTRLTADGRTLLWEGDVAYEDGALVDVDKPRHRLQIADLPWVYQHTIPDSQD